MFDVRYHVNKEKGICTCILILDEWDVLNEYGKRFENFSLGISFNYDSKKFYMPKRIVGIAKCAPEDTFDEDTGKDIAFDKAYKKYLHQKKSLMLKISNYIRFHVDVIDKFLKHDSQKYSKVPPVYLS